MTVEENNALVRADPMTTVLQWMATLPDGGQSLGVSRRWLTEQVTDLALTGEDLDTIYYLRSKYTAGLPHITKLLRKGYTADQAEVFYRVRDELTNICDSNIALEMVGKVIDTFPECDPEDEGLAEMLAEIHQEVCSLFPWMVRNVDSSMRWLIQLAKHHRVHQLNTVVNILRQRRKVLDEE